MSDKKITIQLYLSLLLLFGVSSTSFSQVLMYCSNNNYSFQHMHNYLYIDADNDGYGSNVKSTSLQCTYKVPRGYSTGNTDCNDSNASINPGTTWYRDADGDTYGNAAITTTGCTQPTGYVSNYNDCNDSDGSVAFTSLWYRDADGDGYGTSSVSTTSCNQPAGYVHNSSDYNDGTTNITNIPPQTFYRDADGDGYGSTSVTVYYSVQPSGYVTNNLDCNDGDSSLNPNTPWFRDNDGDGYGLSGMPVFSCSQPSGYARLTGDCNDYNSSITTPITWYRDGDGDGYGTSATTITSCTQPSGYVRNTSDYDDGTANITNIAPSYFYYDGDGDGFGDPNISVYYSVAPSRYVTNNTDCNDANASLNPNTFWYADADADGYGDPNNRTNSCTKPIGFVNNGSDYNDGTANITNITPQTFYRDVDGDGFGDSSANAPTLYYSVIPTGYANNNRDCNDNDASLNPLTIWYRDVDGDGYGTIYATNTTSCNQPVGYVRNSSDYDDSTTNITNIAPSYFYYDGDSDSFGNPNSWVYYSFKPTNYVTNNLDCNDGDTTINPNTVWYRDVDGDGYGTVVTTTTSCTQPSGYVSNANDCADGDTSLNPNTFWYADADSDGYGSKTVYKQQCTQPTGYIRTTGDYDDTTVNITNIAPQTFYLDNDGDGFGNPNSWVYYSIKPTNYVTNNLDCVDGDATLNPNTIWYRDADADGFGSSTVTLTQCTQPVGYVRTAGDLNDTLSCITTVLRTTNTYYLDADNDGFGDPSKTIIDCSQPVGYVSNNFDLCPTIAGSENGCQPRVVSSSFNYPLYASNFNGSSNSTVGSVTFSNCSLNIDFNVSFSTPVIPTNSIAMSIPIALPNMDLGKLSNVQGYSVSIYNNKLVISFTPYNGGSYPTPLSSISFSCAKNLFYTYYKDADGDGKGDINNSIQSCAPPTGYISDTSDLNDNEACITNVVPTTFYADNDRDGFGDPTSTKSCSTKPTGYVTNTTDCNDSDASLNPNTFWYADADKDGYGSKTVYKQQCTQPTGYIRTTGDYDDTTVNITNIAPATFYKDADGDTYGSATVTVYYSIKPAGYVTNNLDCNDDDATVNPNTIWYRDADGDGYGTTATTTKSCTQPSGYVRNSSDYSDSTANITNIVPQTFYRDADNDGFGDANPNTPTIYYSVKPAGYATNKTDCDDVKNTINPNTKWYADVDRDGLGDAASFVTQCTAPAGNYVLNNTDNCPLVSGTSSDCGSLANPAQDMNYIITKTYKVASTTSIASPTPAQAKVGITYYDGLGRPMQQIANQQSDTGKDIVTPIEYDAFGRQTKDYLPFVGSTKNMSFDSSAQTNALSFYNTTKYENTANPFSQKDLEASPLNRVLRQSAPGADWAMGQGHEIKLDYQTNIASEVKLFTATTTWNATSGLYATALGNPAGTTFYGVNQLYKNLTFDENTTATPSETSGSTVEFKNKEGQVVLKRTYDAGTKHDTYYVYDVYGNLTYVIPPKADMALTQAILDDLCYQYQYDNRNRLVAKKLPGKQWEYMVYDKLDRVVATGPAFSPFSDVTASGWLITKYDAFNRVVYTGWVKGTVSIADRKTMQDAQNTATTINESKQTSGTIDGITVNYSNVVAPTSFKLLTVNYYDNYTIPTVTPATTVDGQTVATAVKGLATGSWTRVATTTAETKGETSYILYDAKYRPIRSYTMNYLGGYICTDSKLDAFSGQLQYTVQKHKRTAAYTELSIKDAFTYSAQDRLLTHTHQINGGTVQLLAENTYDELGKLISKKVGNTSATPLQKVDYAYNIRGWMKSINNPTALQQGTDPADLFGFKMNYNTVDGNAAVANKLYNGNIAETFWSTATDGGFVRNYGYKYDQLNRLKDATYQKSNLVTRMYDENLTYDKNGNIMTLKRNGDNDAQVGALAIDNLAYTYKTNSNGLLNVADGTNSTSGFNDFNKVGDDYSYDANGNLITDKNKKITAITYNHLNLPTKIVFGTTGSISYVYSGSGQKVEKMVTQGTTITTTNYLNGYLYKNALLQYFPTAEGYVEPNGSSFKYVYQYKDHLGNIRLSYTKNSTTNTLDVIEENNFYPFGLRHAGYNTTIVGGVTEAQKVKFGSKEYQNELNLNVYDFGARVYNPEGGPTFWQIDPINHFSQSPYCAFNGNPVFWADPSGMEGEHYNWSTGQYQDKSGKNISFEDAMAGNGMNANGSEKSNTRPPDWFVNSETGEVYHNENMKKGDENQIGDNWVHLAKEGEIKPIYNFVDSKLFKGGMLYDFKTSIFLMALNDRKLFAQKVIEEKISETVEVRTATGLSTSITNSIVKEKWKNLTYVNSELIRKSTSITPITYRPLSPFSYSTSSTKIINYTTRPKGFWDYVSEVFDFRYNHSKTDLTIEVNGKQF